MAGTVRLTKRIATSVNQVLRAAATPELEVFSIEQINDRHARLGRSRTLPEYVRALNALGVERYDSYLPTAILNTSGRVARGLSLHRRTRCFPSLKPVNA
jgi:hypothetical protein